MVRLVWNYVTKYVFINESFTNVLINLLSYSVWVYVILHSSNTSLLPRTTVSSRTYIRYVPEGRDKKGKGIKLAHLVITFVYSFYRTKSNLTKGWRILSFSILTV